MSVKTEIAADLGVRADFPILKREWAGRPLIYLDTAATSQKPQVVIDAVSEHLARHNANVHRGVYALAQEADAAYDEARARVAQVRARRPGDDDFYEERDGGDKPRGLRVGPHECRPGDEILITAMEHHANIVPWQVLCREKGAELRYLDVDEQGVLDPAQLDERARTRQDAPGGVHTRVERAGHDQSCG